jgi:hypothetical protein
VVPHRVEDDLPQPGLDRSPACVAPTLADRNGEAFVDRVPSRLAVAEDPRRDADEAVEITPVELLDRVETCAFPAEASHHDLLDT